jgi:cobalamin biosynthesis protein CobT
VLDDANLKQKVEQLRLLELELITLQRAVISFNKAKDPAVKSKLMNKIMLFRNFKVKQFKTNASFEEIKAEYDRLKLAKHLQQSRVKKRQMESWYVRIKKKKREEFPYEHFLEEEQKRYHSLRRSGTSKNYVEKNDDEEEEEDDDDDDDDDGGKDSYGAGDGGSGGYKGFDSYTDYVNHRTSLSPARIVNLKKRRPDLFYALYASEEELLECAEKIAQQQAKRVHLL